MECERPEIIDRLESCSRVGLELPSKLLWVRGERTDRLEELVLGNARVRPVLVVDDPARVLLEGPRHPARVQAEAERQVAAHPVGRTNLAAYEIWKSGRFAGKIE